MGDLSDLRYWSIPLLLMAFYALVAVYLDLKEQQIEERCEDDEILRLQEMYGNGPEDCEVDPFALLCCCVCDEEEEQVAELERLYEED